MHREPYHLKNSVEVNLIPVTVRQYRTRFTEQYANIREHQLSPVCLAVPVWLAVK
jgi:hypothetical protein